MEGGRDEDIETVPNRDEEFKIRKTTWCHQSVAAGLTFTIWNIRGQNVQSFASPTVSPQKGGSLHCHVTHEPSRRLSFGVTLCSKLSDADIVNEIV